MSDGKSPIVLRVVVNEEEDAEQVQDRAKAEHLAAHPEDAGRERAILYRQSPPIWRRFHTRGAQTRSEWEVGRIYQTRGGNPKGNFFA